MSFVVGIALLTILLIKELNHKIVVMCIRKTAEIEAEEREVELNVWKKSVYDDELEYKKSQNYSQEDRDIIKQYGDIISKVSGIMSGYDPRLMIVMSQYGKIPGNVALFGISIISNTKYESRIEQEWLRKFMILYDFELKNHGVKEDLLLVRSANIREFEDTYNRDLAVLVSETEPGDFGIYFWWPVHHYVL